MMLVQKQKKILIAAYVILFFLLFGLLIATVIYFKITNIKYQEFLGRGGQEKLEVPKGMLSPSQILGNKAVYHKQKITLRGQVSTEPVVCEKKKCPSQDSCCGCPFTRDLVIKDLGKTISSEDTGRLRLLDSTGKPFCVRVEGTCKYDCQDWHKETNYDVSGTFFAEMPPPGWKMSLEYYFLVEAKTPLGRFSFSDSLNNFFNELKGLVEKFRFSRSYVLTE